MDKNTMDTELKAKKQMDLNEKTIKDAKNKIDQMAQLRARLHIRDGAGQRYLKKLKPEQGLLQQAEKEIMSQYASSTTPTSSNTSSKSKLLRNMAKRNTI